MSYSSAARRLQSKVSIIIEQLPIAWSIKRTLLLGWAPACQGYTFRPRISRLNPEGRFQLISLQENIVVIAKLKGQIELIEKQLESAGISLDSLENT